MAKDEVADHEMLFRRVGERSGDSLCYLVKQGRVRFSTSAFNDPGRQPSFNRAAIHGNDPHRTRLAVSDGVIALGASAIRGLSPIDRRDSKGKLMASGYEVGVTPDPLFKNCAHAVVCLEPETGSGFKKLKEQLVRLADEAGWKVEPPSPLPSRNHLYDLISDHLGCLVRRLQRRE